MSDAQAAWVIVALLVGLAAGWQLGRAHAVRLCRRIVASGGDLDRVFAEDARSDPAADERPRSVVRSLGRGV